ncbi:hypothetical protein [Leucobacter massiliensis]|uniref:Uncharacterized protein n=1 Tax=Leucobacter massiliensis TaxID=1686285 RepID=A0A2S9QK76_9MICO|nr:hypothetical protein [Leucobacter massiliensis]PRI09991.1 hypothetical protein B4915_13775 [Leucobacter massiliensis]
MDLKFTFGGASPDRHDHGGAPSGVPLPFSTVAPGAGLSTSSVLEVRARRAGTAALAEAVSGDGVVYASAEVAFADDGPASLARAVRSALSRAVAGLEGPLAESVSAVVLELGDAGQKVLAELGIADAANAAVDEALQRRIGVGAGTPVRLAG